MQEQVAQLDRLGRLKGFFSPQLAESIINGGGEDLLKTHRREVVVVFLDLRGFTAFTDSAEPEEVMAVLGEYHRAMGPLILAHEGTLEHFAGDGIMIFFNDPIQLDNPAENAVSMALAMQRDFVPLRAAWKQARLRPRSRHRHRAGLRDARRDRLRGALGILRASAASANLASRLCNEAKGGQILTNQKTLAADRRRGAGRTAGRSDAEGHRAPGAGVERHRLQGLNGRRGVALFRQRRTLQQNEGRRDQPRVSAHPCTRQLNSGPLK